MEPMVTILDTVELVDIEELEVKLAADDAEMIIP